ncbi:hypothetical protein J3459_007543 [Metarhizium acridum]|uniref:uncharacterized protein n=1 Tax=Metarhizium acridum TaxID=92637 RepID=UPI001C6AD0AE|nr:hypothetical protein J3458_003278 [Metarhizium acridum]KAG8427074.1 hypothetical protein J3459_007543 [Metarhizium acridum]
MSTITDYSGGTLGRVGVMRTDKLRARIKKSLQRPISWLARGNGPRRTSLDAKTGTGVTWRRRFPGYDSVCRLLQGSQQPGDKQTESPFWSISGPSSGSGGASGLTS